MKTIEVICALCGNPKTIPLKEYTRQTKRGRTNWFCSDSHAAQFYNEPRKCKPIIKNCAACDRSFSTVTGKSDRDYCSTSCASKATVPREAQRRGGLNSPHPPSNAVAVLKSREAFKYVNLEAFLKETCVPHEFEKYIDGKIFDLVLTEKKVCVEFDGPDHKGASQRKIDAEKNAIAARNGYNVIRISANKNEVIDPRKLHGLV